jgi:hypothetical protein
MYCCSGVSYLQEMAAARHPEAANAARTETGGGSQAEQAQAAVKSGLSGFTPEEKVDEVRAGWRRASEGVRSACTD